MLLSDRHIARAIAESDIAIEPYDHNMFQPASVDLRLGKHLLIPNRTNREDTDPRQDSTHHWVPYEIDADSGVRLNPGDFFLGATYERVTLGSGHAARFEGKSSLGRIGLLTHITAGFIDPGFSGHITVELSNVSRRSIRLYPGMKIGQICFMQMSGRPLFPYGSKNAGSHYQNQPGPVSSRIHENFHQATI